MSAALDGLVLLCVRLCEAASGTVLATAAKISGIQPASRRTALRTCCSTACVVAAAAAVACGQPFA